MRLFTLLLSTLISLSAAAASVVPSPTPPASVRLNWGPQNSQGFPAALKAVLLHAQDPGVSITPLTQIFSEGLVFSDPKKIKSLDALKTLPYLLFWSICGKQEPDMTKREACAKRARDGILGWVNRYKSDGNPINEMKLFSLFFAIDLSFDGFSKENQTKIKAWLKSIYDAELANFESMSTTSSRYLMNHRSWSLSVRAMTAKIIGDTSGLNAVKSELSSHAKYNIESPSGKTNDFDLRDALGYQTYNLEAYAWMALFVPEVMSAEVQKKFLQGILFIKPYFEGKKKHIEYAKSQVGFDKIRRDAGDAHYQIKNWERDNARLLLRLARAVLPEIRSWTQPVVDENYPSEIKFIAASQSR